MGVVSFRSCHRIVYNNYFIVVYSDMKKIILLLIVLLVYLVHIGEAQVDVNKDNKLLKVPNDEWPTQVIYDTTNICYQGTLRWIVMGNPNLANQLPPVHIVRTMIVHCFCVMDKLRTEYKFTPYTDFIGKDNPMNPRILPNKFMTKAIQCIQEHNTLSGLVVLDQKSIDMFGEKINKQKDNETKKYNSFCAYCIRFRIFR